MQPSTALKIVLFTCAGALCLITALRTNSRTGEQTARELPVLGSVPAFELESSEGRDFKREDTLGKIWVADFIFTSCPGPCPAMAEQMSTLHRRFRNHPDVHLTSISVDPETDTAEVLTSYAAEHGADTERWHFLRGDKTAIQELSVAGFKIGSKDNLINHSTKFVLIDRLGRIRGYYEGTDEESVGQLAKDIELLLNG